MHNLSFNLYYACAEVLYSLTLTIYVRHLLKIKDIFSVQLSRGMVQENRSADGRSGRNPDNQRNVFIFHIQAGGRGFTEVTFNIDRQS